MRLFIVLTLCLVGAAYLTGFSTSALQDAVPQGQTAIVARTVIVTSTVAVVTYLVVRRFARPALLAVATAALASYVLFPGTWYAETLFGEVLGGGTTAQVVDAATWMAVVLTVALIHRARARAGPADRSSVE